MKKLIFYISAILLVLFHVLFGVGALFNVGPVPFEKDNWLDKDGKPLTEETFGGVLHLFPMILGLWYTSTGIAMVIGILSRTSSGVICAFFAPLVYHLYCTYHTFTSEEKVVNEEKIPISFVVGLHLVLGLCAITVFVLCNVVVPKKRKGKKKKGKKKGK